MFQTIYNTTMFGDLNFGGPQDDHPVLIYHNLEKQIRFQTINNMTMFRDR